MASAIRQLAGMGGDVRKIAALLKKKAPPGHILAYISPQEAQLLKARGGSGKEHENTGILSFEEDSANFGSEFPSEEVSQTPAAEPGSAAYMASEAQNVSLPNITQQLPSVDVSAGRTPYGGGVDVTAGQQIETPSFAPGRTAADTRAIFGEEGYGAAASPAEMAAAPAAKPTAPGEKGLSKDMMAKLGIAGVGGLLGGLQARRAAAQGQAGKQEMAALAQPYAQKGAELRGAAERGELTPQAQRAVQAARAQIAQGAERRGGVGVQQAESQIQALTQNLLQQQYDLGLKLSGISDNIMMGAIKTGLQADQYANQLTSSYFNNVARTVYGSTTAKE